MQSSAASRLLHLPYRLRHHKQKSRTPIQRLGSSSFHLVLVLLLFIITLPTIIKQVSSQNNTQQAIKQPNYLPETDLNCHPTKTTTTTIFRETGRQITGILDRFMSLGYDKRVRPNYGGPPVEVNVTMRILSISSVSEVMMDFTADFYFRQTWHDPRLAFKKLGDIQTLYVGAEVSKKIWLPDTFFGNEKLAYFHEATTPNVFLRIDHSGEVYRSIRLTVTSSCPMNLQYFPMDRQRCTIEAESYGYNVKDIIYRWARKDTAVERDKEISLPQFDIVKTVQKYRLEELSSGTYSRLIAEIHFARRMGYYLIQIYIPSSLIVVISWVSFWLHRNASPARVQLGVTTVLTMTTLMSSTNAALPKISYVKSIDIFLGTCFVMVFAALLEYATVGYLGKRIAMRKAQLQHAQSQAQARAFAQLQAQGAQGDPVPPVITTEALNAANPNNIVRGIQTDQQQELLMQQLLAAQTELKLTSTVKAPPYRSSFEPSGLENSAAPPQVPERSHCNHCCSTNMAHQQQQQHQHQHRTAGCCNHAQSLPGASDGCWCPVHQEQVAAIGRHRKSCSNRLHTRDGRQHPSHSLPRSCHEKCQLNNANQQLDLAELTTCPHQNHPAQQFQHQSDQYPNLGQQQHQYNQPLSFGTKAAAAAAATFVNMHRKNRGLPPSDNPNFAQHAWEGLAQSSKRNLETIFGVRPSDIDKYSRVVFPVCFVCFQLMYWIVYLHISAFLETEYQQQLLQQQPNPTSTQPIISSLQTTPSPP